MRPVRDTSEKYKTPYVVALSRTPWFRGESTGTSLFLNVLQNLRGSSDMIEMSRPWFKIPLQFYAFNHLTPMSDQDRISPYNINTISTR